MTMNYEDAKVQIQKFVASPYNNNVYIITCKRTRDTLVVDAPKEIKRVLRASQSSRVTLLAITHGHFDHIEGFSDLPFEIIESIGMHEADAEQLPIIPTTFLNQGDIVSLGDLSLQIFHTPGHTPGGICILVNNHLFSGDTLFPGGPGRTSSPENLVQLLEGIRNKLLVLQDDTIVYPGHGSNTTIGKAKKEFSVFESRPHAESLCGNVLWLKD